MSRICILGGGFGGLYTALNLARLPWAKPPQIVLVDRSDRFLFTPLLYELISGELQTWEIAPTFVEVLQGTDVQFVQGTVADIDLANRQVSVSTNGSLTQLSYDRLTIAIGGETPIDLVPGASEHAIPFRNLVDANRLLARLQQLEASHREKIRVCIAGAGSSGVEVACKIADRLKERGRVRLVDRNPAILTGSPNANRAAAERVLSTRGIWTDLSTVVTQITDTEITLEQASGSDTLPVDIVVWTVGNSLSAFVRKLPVPHASIRGEIITENTLQIKDYPDVFAIGDLASCRDADGDIVPATAQVAIQQAQYCAWNIWASLTQRPLVPFRYLPLGEFISLGTDSAAMSFLNRFALNGMPAYVLRRFAYLLRMPTWQHQLKVGFSWVSKPVLEAIANGSEKSKR